MKNLSTLALMLISTAVFAQETTLFNGKDLTG